VKFEYSEVKLKNESNTKTFVAHLAISTELARVINASGLLSSQPLKILCCTSRVFYRARMSHKRDYLLSSDVFGGRVNRGIGRGGEEFSSDVARRWGKRFVAGLVFSEELVLRGWCSSDGFGGVDVVWGAEECSGGECAR
jgi:hypothetical protein